MLQKVLHNNFQRTKYFENVTTKQQYPVLDEETNIKYLIPNIEYPFNAYRIQVTDLGTSETKYLCPREQRYLKRMRRFALPLEGIAFTTNPVKALILSTEPNSKDLSRLTEMIFKLKDILRCSPALFPKSNIDNLIVDAVLCIRDNNKVENVEERYFVLCVTVRGNTFSLISPKMTEELDWRTLERGYQFSLTSCLYRASWKWSRKNLMNLDGFSPRDKDLGLFREAKKCINNHPLCSKYIKITGEGRPGIYLVDPYTFKVLRSWDFTKLVDNTSGHTKSNYQTTAPSIYGLQDEKW